MCWSDSLFKRYKKCVNISDTEFHHLLYSLGEQGLLRHSPKIHNHMRTLWIELIIDSDYIVKSLQDEPWLSPFLFKLLT